MINDFLKSDYFMFAPIVLATIAVASLFDFGLRRYVKSVVKAKSIKAAIKVIERPALLGIIMVGTYHALLTFEAIKTFEGSIDKLFFVLTVFLISFTVSKATSVLIGHWLKVKKRFEKTPQLLSKIISIFIYLIALLIILKYFRIDVSPLVATMGLGGLGIGLALQSTLSNFLGGLHILSDRPVNVGQFVEIDKNIIGTIQDIGWRSTRILTPQNNILIIPNMKLAESTITNYSEARKETNILINCGVSYQSDLDKVYKTALAVAEEAQEKIVGAVNTFEPAIRFHTFGESNIDFTVVLGVEDHSHRFSVKSDFIMMLKKRFDKEGIEIS